MRVGLLARAIQKLFKNPTDDLLPRLHHRRVAFPSVAARYPRAPKIDGGVCGVLGRVHVRTPRPTLPRGERPHSTTWTPTPPPSPSLAGHKSLNLMPLL
ncbi:hypothetical protein J6590_001596 [Homalodisca vitripennis]|nr:hypothetical protein J6590_001596 [Homalodisca vitripennis]